MQLMSKDGIACDYCGITYKNDFDYFSFDFHAADCFNNNRISIEHILRTNVVFSVDICTSCFDSFKKKIVDNYKKVMSDKRRQAPIVCDWTGNILSGTYSYYYCNITKVSVRLNGQPNICAKCGHKTFEDDKQCSKCNGVDFSRLADIDSYNRFLELTLCESAYNHFVDKAKSVRQLAGEWSTKS